MSEYYEILVETFVEPGGRGVRVRTLEGQEFPTNMRVECCKEMRSNCGYEYAMWPKRVGG